MAQPLPRTRTKNSALADRAAVVLGTLLGAGYSPVAPGSVASAITVGLAVTLWPAAISPMWLLLAAAGLLLPGVWAGGRCEQHFGRTDPGHVVFDEVLGQMIALAAIPRGQLSAAGWKYWLLSFILFRVFDIVKPFPVRRSERLPRGWGIMIDDCLAGGYAFVALSIAGRLG